MKEKEREEIIMQFKIMLALKRGGQREIKKEQDEISSFFFFITYTLCFPPLCTFTKLMDKNETAKEVKTVVGGSLRHLIC